MPKCLWPVPTLPCSLWAVGLLPTPFPPSCPAACSRVQPARGSLCALGSGSTVPRLCTCAISRRKGTVSGHPEPDTHPHEAVGDGHTVIDSPIHTSWNRGGTVSRGHGCAEHTEPPLHRTPPAFLPSQCSLGNPGSWALGTPPPLLLFHFRVTVASCNWSAPRSPSRLSLSPPQPAAWLLPSLLAAELAARSASLAGPLEAAALPETPRQCAFTPRARPEPRGEGRACPQAGLGGRRSMKLRGSDRAEWLWPFSPSNA